MYIHVTDRMLNLVRAPTNLSYGEILLLAYISGLERVYITNETLADLLNTSVRSIKRWLSKLNAESLIDVYYERINGVDRRIIVPKMTP